MCGAYTEDSIIWHATQVSKSWMRLIWLSFWQASEEVQCFWLAELQGMQQEAERATNVRRLEEQLQLQEAMIHALQANLA